MPFFISRSGMSPKSVRGFADMRKQDALKIEQGLAI